MAETMTVRRTAGEPAAGTPAGSPDAARAEIQRTRARMDATIDELAGRLAPDHLKHELGARVRGEVQKKKKKAEAMMHDAEAQANKAGHTVMETIRKNPIPAAMIGIGAGMLVKKGRKASHKSDGRWARERAGMERGYAEPRPAPGTPLYEEEIAVRAVPVESDREAVDRTREQAARTGQEAKQKAAETGERAKQKAAETGRRAKQKAENTAHKAREKAGRAQHKAAHAAHEAERTAGRALHRTQREGRRLEHRVERTVNENPLAAGAAALALGLAVGAVVPETRKEDRMMGPARDRLMDRAEQKGEEVKEKAKHVADAAGDIADAAAGAATDEAKSVAKEPANRGGMSA